MQRWVGKSWDSKIIARVNTTDPGRFYYTESDVCYRLCSSGVYKKVEGLSIEGLSYSWRPEHPVSILLPQGA